MIAPPPKKNPHLPQTELIEVLWFPCCSNDKHLAAQVFVWLIFVFVTKQRAVFCTNSARMGWMHGWMSLLVFVLCENC